MNKMFLFGLALNNGINLNLSGKNYSFSTRGWKISNFLCYSWFYYLKAFKVDWKIFTFANKNKKQNDNCHQNWRYGKNQENTILPNVFFWIDLILAENGKEISSQLKNNFPLNIFSVDRILCSSRLAYTQGSLRVHYQHKQTQWMQEAWIFFKKYGYLREGFIIK